MFLHLCVILFTGRRGVCPTPTPIGRPGGWADPPGCRPPRVGQTPSPGWANPPRCRSPWVGQTPAPPPDTVNKRAVRNLLECTLVKLFFWMNAFKFVKCMLWRTTSNVRSYSIALRLVPCHFCYQHKIFNSIQFNVQIKSLCQLYRRIFATHLWTAEENGSGRFNHSSWTVSWT